MELTVYRSDEVPDIILMLLQRDYLILQEQLATTNGVNEPLTYDQLVTPLEDLTRDYIDLATGYTSQVDADLLSDAYRFTSDNEDGRMKFLEYLINTKNAIGEVLMLLDEFEDRQEECECYLIVAQDYESTIGCCLVLQHEETIVTHGLCKFAGISLISYLLPEMNIWQDLPYVMETALDDLGQATGSEIVIASDTIPDDEVEMMIKYHNYTRTSYEDIVNIPCGETTESDVIFRYI